MNGTGFQQFIIYLLLLVDAATVFESLLYSRLVGLRPDPTKYFN